ncbi:MAG: pilus assembly protein N-terminal domain-containing protein [Rhodobacteraceae bacterium]|jgi:pilus assembly protein CpaC|nr:pilus assembly protein N-terminal domain-containing protein [Paracoccaceae bacterium]
MTTRCRRAAALSACFLALAAAGPAGAEVGALRVTASEGVFLDSPADMGTVLIADPAVANVQPVSDRSFFLFGKSVGATTLYILDLEDRVVLQRRVVVTRSLSQLQDRVRD